MITEESLWVIKNSGVGEIRERENTQENTNDIGYASMVLSANREFFSPCEEDENLVWAGVLGKFDIKENRLIKPVSHIDKQVLTALLRLVFKSDSTDLLLQDSEPITIKKDGRIWRISDSFFDADQIYRAVEALTTSPTFKSDVTSNGHSDISVRVSIGDGTIASFRLNGTRTESLGGGDGGVQLSFRKRGTVIPNYDDLGVAENIREALNPPKGGVIVIADPAQGKSTLLAAAVIAHAEIANDNIVTYENPVEQSFRVVEPAARRSLISQTDVRTSFGGKWEEAAANFLRRSTSTVLLGEITGYSSAKAYLQMANAGAKIWTTAHATVPHEFFIRFKSFFKSEEQDEALVSLMLSLRSVICVALVNIKDGSRIQLRGCLTLDEKLKRDIELMGVAEKLQYLRSAYITQGNTLLDDLKRNADKFSAEQYQTLSENFQSQAEI